MKQFEKLVLSPVGWQDVSVCIAACRAGAVGIVNAELGWDPPIVRAQLERMVCASATDFGIKVPMLAVQEAETLASYVERGLRWIIVDARRAGVCAAPLRELRARGARIVLEVVSPDWPEGLEESEADGLILKGNEAGGYVGEDSSFILVQKWLRRTRLPLYIRGGLTPQVAAGCHAVGVVGGVLDSQVLLFDEVQLPASTRAVLANLAGNETVAVGDGERGEYFRVLSRPGHLAARKFVVDGEGLGFSRLHELVSGSVGWTEPRDELLPVGQDVCFAAPWRERYGRLASLVAAIDRAIEASSKIVIGDAPVAEGGPLARELGIRYPIVQGPMTRVSDVAEFAKAVADSGALPMVAFALLKGEPLVSLLRRTSELLAEHPWGIGLLGFAPQSLLDEQLSAATKFRPKYAIIAGGRPDQAVQLEQAGIATFLHVPSANLIGLFLQEGARRFIFEGRECGGHVGPLSSFVLWSAMVDRLLVELDARKAHAEEIQLLFAGGIHDAASSAIVQLLAAPLVARGVRIGVLMGSAYLFTREIVATGAIVPGFQQEALACERTVNLESGPGHASRCGYTQFAEEFFRKRRELRAAGTPGDESRSVLDDLIMGRLRIASKGLGRDAEGHQQLFEDDAQRSQGMYMLGQVATVRGAVTDIASLHAEVTAGAVALLSGRKAGLAELTMVPVTAPADIAIVGMAALLPKANSTREFWDNILNKVDAITEIPSHRWDWRLYYDADRTAKDKIYSKWGGFLDDLAFDPTRYGMPPKSITSVDPMQLMALEVARRTLDDAGLLDGAFDRERASVIIGASGGTGDVGSQYGLRAELPRFSGQLPEEVAARLPEWSEDTFAGLLLNVIAGRIANRLNFGGVNFTTDAACGSSLAALYQGVTELVAGRSDLVIAGGVDTVQGPFGYLCFSKTQALSPRGRCHTFDAEGDGIAISEGIAMVALKRLADAERDGDRIYAVIKGIGGSSDGNAKGLTAPLPAGQLRAMRRAYAMAGFGPGTVGLFEAHGTGTVAGDTAELESTTTLIREEAGRPRQAVIGSVKTNIGHTKATAGVAGLIKAALSLHHRALPPHINVRSPIKALADPGASLYLVDEPTPWLPSGKLPRRAACSAFGFGGTNFHVVLEEYSREFREWLRPATSDRWPAELLLFSDADAVGLQSRLSGLADRLPSLGTMELRDLAASLAAQWRPEAHSLAVVARDTADVGAKLAAALTWLRGEAKALPPGVFHGSAVRPMGKVAVLFSGQGSQYPGMAREAALHFGPVAETLAAADAALAAPLGKRFGEGTLLTQFIWPRGAYDEGARSAARAALTRTDIAQPALGAVEAGLWALMSSLGLQAQMFAGHSYGEFVALHAAGVIDFPTLMTLSAARGRFIVDAAAARGAELGTMAAVQTSRELVEKAIADIDGVVVANHNAPRQTIISGAIAAVQAASEKLAGTGAEVVAVPVAAAFHSSLVRPAQEALAALIESTTWSPPLVPVYSNTTADEHAAEVAVIKQRMAEHLVRPVEFVAEIEAMYRDGARIFLEIGPKTVLTRLASRILENRPHVAVAVDDGGGLAGLLGGVAQLLCAGVHLDPTRLFAKRDCRIGDPNHPEALRPPAPHSRNSWLINGSGVRRINEPARQVGVTLEQAVRNPATRSDAAAAPPVPLQPLQSGVSATAPTGTAAARAAALPSSASTQSRRGGRSMDERRTSAGASDASVMSDYFETMRLFLQTQERVMSSFLGEAAPALRSTMRPRGATPIVLPRLGEVPGAPTPVAPAGTPLVSPALVVAAQANQATTATAAPPAAVRAPTGEETRPSATEPRSAGEGEGLPLRARLVEMLLGIVEEKTGYPRDMVGLDQNLEADLGIDSIKRVEVVGALLQALPASVREGLKDSRTKLNTQSTLNGMLDLLGQAKAGGATVPFDLAGAGLGADAVSHPPRHVMRPLAEAVPSDASRWLTPGSFILTRDGIGVADSLAARLAAAGADVHVVDDAAFADEATLVAWCASRRAALPQVAGLVHLAQIGQPPLELEAGPVDWRAALWRAEKSFFVLLREFSSALPDGGHVLAVSALGGNFGRGEEDSDRSLRLQGGFVGACKSLLEERPSLRIKTVDLNAEDDCALLAGFVFDELTLDGGRQEVGYPKRQRTVFRTVAEPVLADPMRSTALHDLVVVATGGARGITAEALRALASPGNVLVLTGRSQVPVSEEPALASLTDGDQLRDHFVAEVRAGRMRMTPADIQRRVQGLLAEREMRLNLDDLRKRGATVEYSAVDVMDAAALSALLADIRMRFGRIDGVVHGAGVIEDRRLADKQSDSWSRVVETKVIGLLALAKELDASPPRFFTVFSSVAGRYGNSGQADYATANELMNRLCCALQRRWGDAVSVSALCWGPWGATAFGKGMVTTETEAKFAAKGVTLVSPALGRELFLQELARAPGTAVEVICGQGDWEGHEAAKGTVVRAHSRSDAVKTAAARPAEGGASASSGAIAAPLLGVTGAVVRPAGALLVPVQLDRRHVYLREHVIDEVPVLPAAAALELLAEAAQSLWPGWQVVEVREFRMMKGVELKESTRALQVLLKPAPYGSSDGFEVSAALQSDLGNGRALTHYAGVARLAQTFAEPPPSEPRLHREKALSVRQAYDEWLFHGPRFQVIDRIAGLSEGGAEAQVRVAAPREWLASLPERGENWVFDPAIIDAAAQMAWLWARAFRGESALPARFGRVERFGPRLPSMLTMRFDRVATDDPSLVRGNVQFVDETGRVVLVIEELDSIASAALNRLGGTARTAEDTTA